MAALGDIVSQLDDLDHGLTIYAAKPWAETSGAAVAEEDSHDARAAVESGMVYMLEVSIAKEVVETWIAWRSGRQPTLPEKCEAIIYYATNDAYLP